MSPLTEREIQVLGELECAVRQNHGRRIAPIDLGGKDGSHHSSTLARLCAKGYATRRKYTFFGDCDCRCGPTAMFGHRCRGSFSYGITDLGKSAIKEHNNGAH